MNAMNAMKTIRALRLGRGWTQFELAVKVGVQPQTVYYWESGRRTPHVPQLRTLGKLFELCSDEIDLAPGPRTGAADHAPHADRQVGERTPGRDASGQVITRGRQAPASGDP